MVSSRLAAIISTHRLLHNQAVESGADAAGINGGAGTSDAVESGADAAGINGGAGTSDRRDRYIKRADRDGSNVKWRTELDNDSVFGKYMSGVNTNRQVKKDLKKNADIDVSATSTDRTSPDYPSMFKSAGHSKRSGVLYGCSHYT